MKKLVVGFIFVVIGFFAFSQDLLPYEDEWNAGTFGYIDETGKIIIPAQIRIVGRDWPEQFFEGMLRFTSNSNTTTFFKTDGTRVTYNFSNVGNFSNGIASAYSNRSFFLKINGDSFPNNYGYIYRSVDGRIFNEGVAFVSENNKTIAIDTSFNRLFELPVSFQNTSHKFSSGLLAVRNARGLWGYMDTTGRMVIPAKFALSGRHFGRGLYENDSENEYANFQGNYAILTDDGQNFYVINKQGEMIKNFETAYFDFPLGQMFIHRDYLVYQPIKSAYDAEEFAVYICNLITGEETQVQIPKDEWSYDTGRPIKLGENILCNNIIFSYNGEIITQVSDFNSVDDNYGDKVRIWYNKYIVIRNEGYFTYYDQTGREITLRQ